MKQYQELLSRVLAYGEEREDRTGVGTLSLFGEQVRYNLTQGFPAVTTKKLAFKQVIGELIGFIRGYTTLEQFHSVGCTVWDANGNDPKWLKKMNEMPEYDGLYTKDYLGRIYGRQWRDWAPGYDSVGIDQIENVIASIKKNPQGRRHIVTAWDPSQVEDVCLPPCHILYQFYAHNNGYLSLQMYQRSCDLFLGGPFNVASYALLLHIIAELTDLKPLFFIHTIGDAHIYKNHIEQVKLQLSRIPYKLPNLKIHKKITSIDTITPDFFGLEQYQHHPSIKGEMAV